VSKIIKAIVGASFTSLLGASAIAPSHHVKILHSDYVTTTTVAPVVPIVFAKYDTTNYDDTAYLPSPTDPLRFESREVQERFACVRFYESRNHPYSFNPTSSAHGWYQFLPYIWQYAAVRLHLPLTVSEATTDQQSTAALWYYHRNNGLAPEWGDGC
jgi:hypothetical protein